MDHLYLRGKYAEPITSARRGSILLDPNMPKKDEREALGELNTAPDSRRNPSVVLATSRTEEGTYCAYDLGANSFITKPVAFESLVIVGLAADDTEH
jgi:two-component system, response regulator